MRNGLICKKVKWKFDQKYLTQFQIKMNWSAKMVSRWFENNL